MAFRLIQLFSIGKVGSACVKKSKKVPKNCQWFLSLHLVLLYLYLYEVMSPVFVIFVNFVLFCLTNCIISFCGCLTLEFRFLFVYCIFLFFVFCLYFFVVFFVVFLLFLLFNVFCCCSYQSVTSRSREFPFPGILQFY